MTPTPTKSNLTCPSCQREGELVFKRTRSNRIVLQCDECEMTFDSIAHAADFDNDLNISADVLQDCTPEEVKEAGMADALRTQ